MNSFNSTHSNKYSHVSALRRWIAPLLLMLFTPVIVIVVWISIANFQGSLMSLFNSDLKALLPLIPKPSVKAGIIIISWIVAQWFLLRFLPGSEFKGPLTKQGNQPSYKNNGILAWCVTHGVLFGILYPLGIINPAKLYDNFGSVLITLNISAFVFCILLYIKGKIYPSSSDVVFTGNLLFDFFQGLELYPSVGKISLKQLINCRVSMMGWSTIFVSFLLTQFEIYGKVYPSMLISVLLLVTYLFKFFVWERGYLFSLDIMHDRFGYYICWGVLVWVPSVYCLPALYLVSHPLDISFGQTLVYILVGQLCIWINYSADLQRRKVRDTNGKCKIWGSTPQLIHARYKTEEGKEHHTLLLASGWWGIARHFHYIPEIAAAFMWTLPVGFRTFLPWFYVVFLIILLTDRARRDDLRCEDKYQEYWKEYKTLVPYQMIPGIY